MNWRDNLRLSTERESAQERCVQIGDRTECGSSGNRSQTCPLKTASGQGVFIDQIVGKQENAEPRFRKKLVA